MLSHRIKVGCAKGMGLAAEQACAAVKTHCLLCVEQSPCSSVKTLDRSSHSGSWEILFFTLHHAPTRAVSVYATLTSRILS